MKKLLLNVLCIAASVGIANAGQVTFNFSTYGYDNAEVVPSVTEAPITITFDKASGSNPATYYNTGTGVRTYKGNDITFNGATITKIEFTASTANYALMTLPDGQPGTLAKSDKIQTWEGEAEQIVFGCSGTTRIQKIVVDFVEDGLSSPTFSPLGGTFYEPVDVTISCATEGAALSYSFDNETWTDYTAPVTVSETSTLYAKASANGESKTASADYVIKTVATYNTIAAMLAGSAPSTSGAVSDNFKVGFDATVVYVSGAYVYITDGTDYALLYKFDTGFTAGDVINSGWTANIKNFSSLLEIIPVDALTKSDVAGVVPTPAVTTASDITVANQAKYVTVKDVIFATATPASSASGSARSFTGTTLANEDITFFNQFALESVPAGQYDVTGFIAAYNNKPQIYVTAMEAVAPAAEPCATPTFSPEGGEVYAGTQVTITSTPGSYITWTMGDNEGEGPSPVTVTVNESGTIVAVAFMEGMEEETRSETGTATFTVIERPEVTANIFYAAGMTNAPEGGVALVNKDGSNTHSGNTTDATSLNGVTFNGKSVSVKFVADGTTYPTTYGDHVRWYTEDQLIITPLDEQVKIEKVTIACVSSSKNGTVTATDADNVAVPTLTGDGAANTDIVWAGNLATGASLTITPSSTIRFSTITVDTNDLTGIETVESNNANGEAIYYNLQGVRVANPQSGLYIIRRGNTATKVLVK